MCQEDAIVSHRIVSPRFCMVSRLDFFATMKLAMERSMGECPIRQHSAHFSAD
jgi:hypothetical protein